MILTSTDSLKLIMENNLAIDKCLRVFSQFKFVMVLNGNLLQIKLFQINNHQFFFKGVFAFESLSTLYTSIFKNMSEIYQQYKAINEDLLKFNSKHQLIYTIQLATKKLKFILPLKAQQRTSEEDLLLENFVLNREKVECEQIIVEKDKEIDELKSQVEKFKELMNNWKKNQLNESQISIQSAFNGSNQINLDEQNENGCENVDKVDKVAISLTQDQSQQEEVIYKRSRSKSFTEEPQPLTYFSKINNANGQPQKIQIIKKTNYIFSCKAESPFTWENNVLTLNSKIHTKKYCLFFENFLKQAGSNILGFKILSNEILKENRRESIRFGIKCIQFEKERYDFSKENKNLILLDVQKGRIRIFDGTKRIVQDILTPANEEDTIHFRVESGKQKILNIFYKGEKFDKDFVLPDIFSKFNLLPFVEMYHDGDSIQLL